jgi:hypothetical protein
VLQDCVVEAGKSLLERFKPALRRGNAEGKGDSKAAASESKAAAHEGVSQALAIRLVDQVCRPPDLFHSEIVRALRTHSLPEPVVAVVVGYTLPGLVEALCELHSRAAAVASGCFAGAAATNKVLLVPD